MSVTLADGVVLTVEIGFSTSAGANTVPINSTLASITWTDVSADVRSCSIKRGRSSELDSFNTGSCQIVFANADRKYDPEYASGTYYGKLTPGRPIRVKATPPSGAATGIFFGFVDQWNQQYNYPNDATAVVTASDAFKVMNLITLPSYWEWSVQNTSIANGQTNPAIWYRLDDAPPSSTPKNSQIFSSTYNWVTTSGAAATPTQTNGLIENDTNAAASFDGTKYLRAIEDLSGYGPATIGSITAGCWIKTSTTTTSRMGVFSADSGYTTQYGFGVVVSGGIATITGWAEGKIVNIPTVVNDGLPHFVVVRMDYGNSSIWVDGIKTNFSTGTSYTPVDVLTQYTIGGPAEFSTNSANNFSNAFVGVIDEYFQYSGNSSNGALADSDVSALYQAGLGTALAGQTTSARITSLLTMCGWMSDGTDLSAGNSTVSAIDSQGKSLLVSVKECETAEQGRLFIDGNGKLVFISRNALATTAKYKDSQRTFGDSTGELPFTDIEFVYNDQLVKNRVIISRNNGLALTINDTTSQGQYFIRTDSQSGYINDTDQAIVDAANFRLATYKQPSMRIQSLGINPRANTTIYAGLIGDEIGTRITVNRRPQGVGSVISKQLLIEGVSHEIGPRTWSATYNLSPAPLPFFVLNDATYGVLDSNYLGY